MFTNAFALAIGLRTLNSNKKLDKSERNKALLLPLFIKDSTGAVLTADLAAKKAINEADLKDKQTELNITKNLADASIILADEVTSALKNIELALDKDVIDKIRDVDELKQYLSDNITPHLTIQLPKEIREAIISARPDLSPVAARKAVDLTGVKALLSAPVS